MASPEKARLFTCQGRGPATFLYRNYSATLVYYFPCISLLHRLLFGTAQPVVTLRSCLTLHEYLQHLMPP
jgi:hypothetical protein